MLEIVPEFSDESSEAMTGAKPYTIATNSHGEQVKIYLDGSGTDSELPTEPGKAVYVIEGKFSTVFYPDGKQEN